jgi:hypothetical protein
VVIVSELNLNLGTLAHILASQTLVNPVVYFSRATDWNLYWSTVNFEVSAISCIAKHQQSVWCTDLRAHLFFNCQTLGW